MRASRGGRVWPPIQSLRSCGTVLLATSHSGRLATKQKGRVGIDCGEANAQMSQRPAKGFMGQKNSHAVSQNIQSVNLHAYNACEKCWQGHSASDQPNARNRLHLASGSSAARASCSALILRLPRCPASRAFVSKMLSNAAKSYARRKGCSGHMQICLNFCRARSNNFLNALRHSRSPHATGFEETHAHNSQGLFAKALRPAIGPSSRKMSKVVGRHAPEARAFKRNRNLVPKTQSTLQGGRRLGPTLLELI